MAPVYYKVRPQLRQLFQSEAIKYKELTTTPDNIPFLIKERMFGEEKSIHC